MIRGWMVAAVALLGLVASCAAAQGSGDRATLTPDLLRQDLRAMAETLRTRHRGVFHFTRRDRFEASLAELERGLTDMNPNQAFVGFARIAAAVGDAHTYLEIPADSPRLPVLIARFGEEFRIAAAIPGYERALGARLVAVGSVPAEQAYERALELAARNENLPLRELWATNFLTSGVILNGLGLAPSERRATLTLQGDGGAPFDIEAELRPPQGRPGWISAARAATLARTRPEEGFWCVFLSEARTVYCNIRRYQDLGRHSRDMLALIERERPAKVVIDLRQQATGGDYNAGERLLVRPFAQHPELNHPDRLFVLIGPGTFSAAMNNAAQFQSLTRATLVGRPIGEKPNSWQEGDERRLPHSGWKIHYSTRFYEFQPGGENIVRPDVEIVPTWEDFRAGRDAALEYVLSR